MNTRHLWSTTLLALAAAQRHRRRQRRRSQEARQHADGHRRRARRQRRQDHPRVQRRPDDAAGGLPEGLGHPPGSVRARTSRCTSIKAADIGKHEAKLTAGTKEMLKKYPATMRVDVYPTHRSMAFPKYVIDNTAKNATSVKTTDGGLGVEGTYAGIPFPIPKTGNEVMWNHLLRYNGQSYYTQYDSVNVDSRRQGGARHHRPDLCRLPVLRPQAHRRVGRERRLLPHQDRLHRAGSSRRRGTAGAGLHQPDEERPQGLAVPAGPAPRQAGTRYRLRHAQPRHGRRLDL